MNEAHEEEYTFCPKCGALTRGGVCVNCGYGRENGVPEGQAAADAWNENSAGMNGVGQNGAGYGQQNAAVPIPTENSRLKPIDE